MAGPTKLNLKIYQGSTFRETLRWESPTKIYVPITMISKSAPMVVTATNHQIPNGWRAKITGAQGMKEANTIDYIIASDVTATTVSFNTVNALTFNTYTGGGVLEYNQPIDLADYTARMQIREKITSETVLETMTTQNGRVLIDNSQKTISLVLSADMTAAYAWKNGVYSLELEKEGIVTALIYGSVSVEREVTR